MVRTSASWAAPSPLRSTTASNQCLNENPRFPYDGGCKTRGEDCQTAGATGYDRPAAVIRNRGVCGEFVPVAARQPHALCCLALVAAAHGGAGDAAGCQQQYARWFRHGRHADPRTLPSRNAEVKLGPVLWAFLGMAGFATGVLVSAMLLPLFM